jgi:hypothetical protein
LRHCRDYPAPKTEKTEMNDKQNCIESMGSAQKATAAWRRETALRFPDDPRNLKAASILDQLATDVTNLNDERWLLLKPYFGWVSETWRAALNLTVRQVGFSQRAKEIDSFVGVLVHQLSQPSFVA